MPRAIRKWWGVATTRAPRRERAPRVAWDPSGTPFSANPSVCRLKAERELRVLGHHVRGPGRVEDHLRVHGLGSLELAHELLHLLGDLRPDRASRIGQCEGHV